MKRTFTTAIVLLFFLTGLQASHIVGGDITYRYKGSNFYEVKLVLFVDCINGLPGAIADDRFASIGVYKPDGSLYTSFTIERTGPQRIDNVNYNCIEPPSNACVDMYTYIQEVNLPPSKEAYFLVFQRCCRNNTITNIMRPDSTGATYFTTIPGTSTAPNNSSAIFKTLPPNFLCVNEKFVFDHSAIDPDGDSLVYELYTPYVGANTTQPRPVPPYGPPFNEISWRNPYHLAFPLGTSSTFKIDSMTGLLSILPRQLGQFVTGVLVKEYREGALVGISRRDYQFNVLPCQLEVFANFSAPELFCEPKINFINKSKGDSFLWDFGVDSGQTDTSTAVNPSYVFPGDGIYNVKLVSLSGNCTDTIIRQVEIRDPSTYVFLNDDTTICKGTSLTLSSNQPSQFYSYLWTPGKWLNDSTVLNPVATPQENITYTVAKSYQGCTYIDSVHVDVLSPKAAFSAPELYCKTAVPFENHSAGDSFFWDFGVEGSTTDTSTAKDPVFNYPGDGDYLITLTVKSGHCKDYAQKLVKVRDAGKYNLVIKNATICRGDSLHIGAGSRLEGYDIKWLPDVWLDDNTVANPLAKPQESITYKIVTTYLECSFTDSVRIEVLDPEPGFTYEIKPACDSIEVQFINTSVNADSYEWYVGGQMVSAEASPTLRFPYGAKVKGWMSATANKQCSADKEFSLELNTLKDMGLFVPNVITPNGDGLNDCFEVVFENTKMACLPRELHIYNRWGELVYYDEYACWDGAYKDTGRPLPAGTYYFILSFSGIEFKGTVNVIR